MFTKYDIGVCLPLSNNRVPLAALQLIKVTPRYNYWKVWEIYDNVPKNIKVGVIMRTARK